MIHEEHYKDDLLIFLLQVSKGKTRASMVLLSLYLKIAFISMIRPEFLNSQAVFAYYFVALLNFIRLHNVYHLY